MKRILTAFTSLVLAAFLLESCEKDENKIYFEGGTEPALTASTAAANLQPPPADESIEAIRFNWTNPDYQFTTGINSQDVNYTLEIDTAGANFTNPKKYSTSISKELSKSYTVGELNTILGNTMFLAPGRRVNLQARVTSSLGQNAVALASNVVAFTATPYAPPPKVELPSSGNLYIVGNATPGDWTNPVPVPTQVFTKKSNTEYEITIQLLGAGKYYLFLPVNGSWDKKYGVPDNAVSGVENGGTFSSGSKDIPAPAASGTYKINVDFQKGLFTVVKQ